MNTKIKISHKRVKNKILNTFSRFSLSALVVTLFFYITPIFINFADKNFNNKEFTNNSKIFLRYKSQSVEHATIYMEAVSSRGKWSDNEPFSVTSTEIKGPIAILTRATVRWTKLINFWQQSPSISQRIGNNTDVMFKVGLGEVPLRQQLTFSEALLVLQLYSRRTTPTRGGKN